MKEQKVFTIYKSKNFIIRQHHDGLNDEGKLVLDPFNSKVDWLEKAEDEELGTVWQKTVYNSLSELQACKGSGSIPMLFSFTLAWMENWLQLESEEYCELTGEKTISLSIGNYSVSTFFCPSAADMLDNCIHTMWSDVLEDEY